MGPASYLRLTNLGYISRNSLLDLSKGTGLTPGRTKFFEITPLLLPHLPMAVIVNQSLLLAWTLPQKISQHSTTGSH